MSVIAMVPARAGSTRLKLKNMALLGGRPLISYAIDAAKESKAFDRVIVNSDHPAFESVAEQYGAEFYLRPEPLGSSSARSDEVLEDFIKKHPAEYVAWVNPTSPLQAAEEIAAVVKHFIDQKLDSLVTVKDESVHCVMDGKPLNFDPDALFARTQDLTPIQRFVYSVMMWRTKTFLKVYEERGHALLAGKLGYFSVSKLSAILIKTPEDLMIAEQFLQVIRGTKSTKVQYDPAGEGLVKGAIQ